MAALLSGIMLHRDKKLEHSTIFQRYIHSRCTSKLKLSKTQDLGSMHIWSPCVIARRGIKVPSPESLQKVLKVFRIRWLFLAIYALADEERWVALTSFTTIEGVHFVTPPQARKCHYRVVRDLICRSSLRTKGGLPTLWIYPHFHPKIWNAFTL